MTFQKATKKRAKLRAALFGPSGAGKTYSALRIATGLGGTVAVIDTEHGSASKYADRFGFDVLELNQPNIDAMTEAIGDAGRAGYAVLIIDSLSHCWQELLADVEAIAKARYRGNTWSAWSEGTPKQRKLIDALLSYPGHLLATMRSKTEWAVEQNDRGKSNPKRVGLAPEQGKGIEYEFDLLMEITTDHIASIIKDRTGRFQDQLIEKPGEEFGQQLLDWLNEGEEAKAPEPDVQQIAIAAIHDLAEALGYSQGGIQGAIAKAKREGKVDSLLAKLRADYEAKQQEKAPEQPQLEGVA